MSFYTSLSGLKAAQTDLSVISNNVANVGALGFKKSRTEFGDVMSTSPYSSGATAGQGTQLKSITQQFTQGGTQTSDRALDVQINGQGFFITKEGLTGNGQVSYTRAGSFGIDSSRYVTDSRGAYVQVLPVDDQGNVVSTSAETTTNLQIPSEAEGTAKPTGALSLQLNMPSTASDISATFDRANPNTYNFSTSTTVMDDTGAPFQATTYYTRTTAASATAGNLTATWEARTYVGDSEIGNAAATPPSGPILLKFDATGAMIAPTGPTTPGKTTLTGADGLPTSITMTVDYANSKASNANFALRTFKQDGFASGQLSGVAVGKDGMISASYSNGTTKILGKLAIANFNSPEELRQTGGAAWVESENSGKATLGQAASGGLGAIQSGALEQSNVDITDELVALITAQRNFQANAKAIDTASQMTQIAVNLRTS
ncbi:MAG TPA: flagellar hook protein FlgE [Sphingomonas sp.]|jgi:flagellar hook protein FlgE|uniref:flagellar hook protein FlgE n=1 Tax=Sphingomonas sp. TaxID=28214 RepID=UPI002ED89F3A